MRVLSTKKLQQNQRELLLNANLSFLEYDALHIKTIDFKIPIQQTHCIITSQNGARAFLAQQEIPTTAAYFCVGQKTAAILSKKGLNVMKIAQNGVDLAHFIIKNYSNETFTYFCGSQRRDELPVLLEKAEVHCNEIVIYETHQQIQTFDQTFDGVLFYSPLGVSAFAKANPIPIAFCIGATTAAEAKKHTDTVVISNVTTIESTIAKAVNYLKK